MSLEDLALAVAKTKLNEAQIKELLLSRKLSGAIVDETTQLILHTRATREATNAHNILSRSFNSIKSLFLGLFSTIKAHPISTAITAITVAISIFGAVQQQIENDAREAARKTQEAASAVKELKESLDGMGEYQTKINDLVNAINDDNTSQADAVNKRKELLDIQNELIKKYGNEEEVVQSITKALNGEADALNSVSKAAAKDSLDKNRQAISDAQNFQDEIVSFYVKWDGKDSSGARRQYLSKGNFDGYFGNDYIQQYGSWENYQLEPIYQLTNWLNDNGGYFSRYSGGDASGNMYFKGTRDQILKSYNSMRSFVENFIKDNEEQLSEAQRSIYENILNEISNSIKYIEDGKDGDNRYFNTKEILNDAARFSVAYDDNMSKLYQAYQDSQQKYNEALTTGNQELISQAYQDVVASYTAFLNSADKDIGNVKKNTIRDWITSLQTEFNKVASDTPLIVDVQTELTNSDSVVSQFIQTIQQKGFTKESLLNIFLKSQQNPATLSDVEKQLLDFANQYIETYNYVAQYTGVAQKSVEDFIGALEKLGVVQSQISDTNSTFSLATYRDDLDKTSNSISKLKTAYDKFLKGNLSDEELFKLIYDKDNGFTELSKYIGNLEEGFKAVADSEIDKVLDKLAEVDIEGLSENDLETYNRLKQYLEDIKADFDDASAAQERFRNELSNSSNTIKSLVSMREEIEKNGKLSRDSVLTLLSDDKYRSIWKPLIENDVEGYTKAINDLIKQEEGNFNALAQQILKSESDNSINEKKKEISEFEKLYKVDLSNWEKLSDDKKKELQSTNAEMLAKQKKAFQDFKRLYGVDVDEFSKSLDTKQLLLEKFRLSEVFQTARSMVAQDIGMDSGKLYYKGDDPKKRREAEEYLLANGLSLQDLINYMQNNTLPESYFNKVNAQFNNHTGGNWFSNFVDDILSNFDINNFYDDKNKSTNSTDTKQTLDWIERRLKKFAQTTREVYADVEKYTNYTDQNSQLNKSISAIQNEIAANNSAYNSYMAFANAVDLSSDYKSKVQNGLLDIETIKDSDLRDKISKYQDLYDKAKSCKDTVESLIKTEKEYATQQLSHIEKYFDNRTNKAKNSLSYYNSTDTDNLFMKKNYDGLRDAYNRQITETENEAAQLRATLNSLSSQGLINSNEWYEWDSKISQLNVSIRELKKSLRDLTDEEMTHIKSYWDNRIGQSENTVSYINAIAGDGTRKGTKNYSGLRNAYNTQIGYISKEVSELQDKLDNGEIEKYSANWYKWTEIIAQGNQKVQELQANIHQLAVEQFNDIQTKYEHQLQSSQHTAKEYESRTKELETKGYLASTQLYQKLSDLTQGNINTLKQQASELSTSLNNAVKSGNIEAGSEEWYKMRDAILSVNEQIDDSRIKIYEYTKTIREARWEVFDFVQDRISQITAESDFIIDVLSNSKLFGDDGNITSKGKATFGLHAQNYDVYMQQVKRYASEIVMVNAQLANDRNNTDIIQRREKLLELQQKSITAAEKEKKAIVDLTKNGFDEQLKSLKKLIDTYTKNLDATKSLYDYQNSISDKTSNISKLQKQLFAYAGDGSEETMAKMQKLQVELQDAQKDLQQTEYEKLISDTKSLLDNLYTDYEETLNKRLDDVDGLLNDTISTINTNSAEINSTLKSSMADVGYTISSDIQSVWNGKGVISDKIISVLDNISNNVANMVIASGNVGTYKKYATGGLVDYEGIAQVDGTPSKPELVLNSADTRNFVNLRDTLRQLSSQPLTMANGLGKFGLIGGAIIPSMLDISSKLPKLAYSGTNHNMNIHNENHIEIGIDKVEDYNDFIAKMQKDKRFEGIIQDMTFGRMNGGISLAKYRH